MKRNLLLIISCSLFMACTIAHQSKEAKISIDITSARILNVDTSSMVRNSIVLDQSHPENLLGMISDFYVRDTSYVFLSNGKVKMFGAEGAVLSGLPLQGRGPREYISIWESWIANDILCMFDMNAAKILQYDFTTAACSEINLPKTREKTFQYLISDKQGYIGKLVFGGKQNSLLELGRFDDSLNFVKSIGEMKITSGIKLAYSFAKCGEEVLYWRPLENNIYAIDALDRLRVKYAIDFGSNTFYATEEMRDDYDILDAMNKEKEKYAGFIRHVYESDQMLSFSFVHNSQVYITLYDKVKTLAQTYQLAGNSSDFKVASLCFTGDSKLAIVTVDEEGVYKIQEMVL